jgi:hypothetical protein
VVASGSNGTLSATDFNNAMAELDYSEFVLMQQEIPIQTVEYITQLSVQKQKKVILNPAQGTVFICNAVVFKTADKINGNFKFSFQK